MNFRIVVYSCFVISTTAPYWPLRTSDGFLIFDICIFVGLLRKYYLTHKRKELPFALTARHKGALRSERSINPNHGPRPEAGD